jgi:hypothetical protein
VRSLTWTIRAGLAIAAAGLAWMLWPSQEADASFAPFVAHPAFTARPRPRILVDEGHLNTHTSGGSYRPFARLMQRDGFAILPSEGRITADILRGGEIFATVNPLGYKGLAQHLANLAGLERAVHFDADAFTDAETRALATWVSNGGRALIIADHAPAGLAARRLAKAFGVEMTNGWAEERGSGEITFTRANGGITEHPIMRGRNDTETIHSMTTFTGQALSVPPGADVLLRLSPEAREYPFRRSREQEGRSAAGLAQAAALAYGRGRVVVMAEAAALTAQRIERPGAPPLLIGMNRDSSDNRQFALNIIHWLMGLLD